MRRLGPLVLIAISVAVLVAIALPNLVEARNKKRRNVSMADMRTIASAIEARATDVNTYAVGSVGATSTATEFASLTPVPFDALERVLQPKYVTKLPRRDGWGNEFEVRVGVQDYAIRSRGSDGRFDADSYTINTLTRSFEQDLVFRSGNFIQYPEGM